MRISGIAGALLLTVSTSISGASPFLRGRFRCGVTDYMWPASVEDAPTATGTGTMELESDGNGKFIAGSLSEHLADDTRRSGERMCTSQLVSGEYRMNSASAGTATMLWKLRPGSDPHCGALHARAPNLGFTESARDYGIVTGTANFFISRDSSSRWVSASDIGVSMAACSTVH